MSRPVPMSGHENKLIALMPCRVTTDGAYGLWERDGTYHRDRYVVGAVNRETRGDGSLWYTGMYFQNLDEAMACMFGRAGYDSLRDVMNEK